jgi:hypothetical protein
MHYSIIVCEFSVIFLDFRNFSPFLCCDVWNEGGMISTFRQISVFYGIFEVKWILFMVRKMMEIVWKFQ